MVEKSNLSAQTAELVCAYVSNNGVPAADLPALIARVHGALAALGAPEAEAAAAIPKFTPAQIRKSITPEALVSFEDGRPYKTLKRHLAKRGLSLPAYRAKWGLPADYPATAASYSEQRSAMAKKIGLGRKGARVRAEQECCRNKKVVPWDDLKIKLTE